MTDPLDWNLLQRYALGECTPEERAQVDQWVGADLERRELLAHLQQVTNAAIDTRPRPDLQASWRRLTERLDRNAEPLAHASATRARPLFAQPDWRDADRAPGIRHALVRWAAPIAAAIVLLAGGSWGMWRTMSHAMLLASAQQFREFSSGQGGRTTVTLRDGTQLVLAPATHLRVPVDFGRSSRTVELDGEALFTVVHDVHHPFAVRTPHTVVRDVGTTFVVRAYADDATERVAVAEGEVALPGATLHANDMAIVDKTGHIHVARDTDVAASLAWSHGVLVFHNTPLREVIADLVRTYNVDIVLGDTTLAATPITASFGQQSLEAVLDVVATTADAHIEHGGRTIVVERGINTPVRRPIAESLAR
ncbi:MAG TPA: FecR domain-containing protein [Gemmatimonadaceae bacterium]|nr:FecR domain-containing protein [Gemmatimonadaceae bacterium]